jgi:mono/diheme cytochrome c family protein
MSKGPFLIFGAFVAVVAVVVYLAVVKEGSESAATVPVEAADEPAKETFAIKCGTCHTLAAAGSGGLRAPNLDDILPTSLAPPSGTGEEIAEANQSAYEGAYGRVLNAIECGLGGRMPPAILEGEDAKRVASFVAAYAGQLGEDQGPLLPPGERETPDAEPCQSEGGAAPEADAG